MHELGDESDQFLIRVIGRILMFGAAFNQPARDASLISSKSLDK